MVRNRVPLNHFHFPGITMTPINHKLNVGFKTFIMSKLLILFCLCSLTFLGYGQPHNLEGKETSANTIHIGIKTGIIRANCRVEYASNGTADPSRPLGKFGALGSFFARMALGKEIYFQPELMITGKGMRRKDQYSTHTIPTRLTYLELPLQILYKPAADKAGFFIGGGPSPSLYIGNNIFYYGYGSFKKFDFGVNMLAGIEVPSGFSINLNYTHGLVNISRNDVEFSKVMNRSLGLGIGYLF